MKPRSAQPTQLPTNLDKGFVAESLGVIVPDITSELAQEQAAKDFWTKPPEPEPQKEEETSVGYTKPPASLRSNNDELNEVQKAIDSAVKGEMTQKESMRDENGLI